MHSRSLPEASILSKQLSYRSLATSFARARGYTHETRESRVGRPSNRFTHRHIMSSSPSPSEVDFPPSELRQILSELSELLKSRNETVSVAETAAGGIISSSLLSSAGASKYYKGGLTLYTLPSRIAYGGWTQETIENYKGPTTDIVEGLAQHVRKELESTYTVAESGTAGPTGGTTPNRRPGYCALAVDCDNGTVTKEFNTGHGANRVKNMVSFATEALAFLKEVIENQSNM